MSNNENQLAELQEKCAELEKEVQIYRSAANLYGIDAMTMLTLAKSQIKTCADNIRLVEKIQEIFEFFNQIPTNLTDDDLDEAFFRYDGEPYCELVCCGIEIIRKYLKKRSEYDEWKKINLPFVV